MKRVVLTSRKDKGATTGKRLAGIFQALGNRGGDTQGGERHEEEEEEEGLDL